MEQHDLEITIGKDGEVELFVKGAKGKGCLKYADFFVSIVGKVKAQRLTGEYYEPETTTAIHLEQET